MVSKQSIVLFCVIILGLLLQQGQTYTFLIRYILMAMLFLSWIDSHVSLQTLKHPKLWILVGMMAGLAIAGFSSFSLINSQLAVIASVLAMTPTALAAPVVTSLVKGQVDFVTASVLVTNSLIAMTLPIVLPLMMGLNPLRSGGSILLNTLVVVALPLTLAQGLRYWFPPLAHRIKRLKPLTFYLWLMGLYFASAKAGSFIHENNQDLSTLIPIALVALLICALNFGLGRWLGHPSLVQETGQALGQKNTMLAVWVCLTFLSPTLALGPMFYIIFQNLYNAYLLSQSAQR
jgi:BASS family bile acid:Na+ symporter